MVPRKVAVMSEQLEEFAIICFASGYWKSSRAHRYVMEELSRFTDVLFVESLGSRRLTSVRIRDVRYVSRRIRRIAGGRLKREAERMWVLSPIGIPVPYVPWVRQLNEFFLASRIRGWLADRDRPKRLAWVGIPTAVGMPDRISANIEVYQPVDDFLSFRWAAPKKIAAMDEAITKRATAVFPTSKKLFERAKALNSSTLMVPHGVHYDHFASVLVERNVATSSRVAFIGTIGDHIDWELIGECAQLLPDTDFDFIGPQEERLDSDVRGANIHIRPAVPFNNLPDVMEQYDALMIPYRRTRVTESANPIKLREYLASGRPIVATPLPEIMTFRSFIEIGEDARSFACAVERAVCDRDSRRMLERRKAVQDQTWEHQVLEMLMHLGIETGVNG